MLHENRFFPRMGGGSSEGYSPDSCGSGGGVRISEAPSPPVFPGTITIPRELEGVAPLIDVPHLRVYQTGNEFYVELTDLLYRQKNNVHFQVKESRWVKLESGMPPIEAWIRGEFLTRSIQIVFDFSKTGAFLITNTDRQLVPLDKAPEVPSAEHWREIRIYPQTGKTKVLLRRTRHERVRGRTISMFTARTFILAALGILVSLIALEPLWLVGCLLTTFISAWIAVRGDRAWHDTD